MMEAVVTGRMPFLSPNQQCQSTEGKLKTCHDLTLFVWHRLRTRHFQKIVLSDPVLTLTGAGKVAQ